MMFKLCMLTHVLLSDCTEQYLYDDYAIGSISTGALSKAGPRRDGLRGVQHVELPHVQLAGEAFDASATVVPLPPNGSFFGIPIVRSSHDVGEPIFDPAVHLALREPSSVALLPEFEHVDIARVPAADSAGGSRLAYSTPFDMLSKEGVRVAHAILRREEVHAHRNHRNVELRGLYYRSPWMRAMMNDPALLAHLGRLAGEPIVPHMLFMDAPSANFGVPQTSVIGATVDPWHFDSVAYVGVVLVSNVEDMDGGELQILQRPTKDEAIDLIESTLNAPPPSAIVNVSYERSGRCIFVQGSEMVHRVTRVASAPEPRMSLVMAFQPANPFQPDKTVLDTWERFDVVVGSAPYEFFRLKAHTMGSALRHLAANEAPTRDRAGLAKKLRAIAAELERSAALINHETSDFIGFVDEGALDDRRRAAEARAVAREAEGPDGARGDSC
jgi:hypothetical protein